MNNPQDIREAINIGIDVATFLLNTRRVLEAIELFKECLILLSVKGRAIIEPQSFKWVYTLISAKLFRAYYLVYDYAQAESYGRMLLVQHCDDGERALESKLCIKLGSLYDSQSKYEEAKELYERALGIATDTGDKEREADAYGNLGVVFQSLGEYAKAREYQEKALKIEKEIGYQRGEAVSFENLGVVFSSLGEDGKAKEYFNKALAIKEEIGDIGGEASCYGNLGSVFHSLGDYVKAKEYHEKALAIFVEIGDKRGEAWCYGNLGILYQSYGDYGKAKEYLGNALCITKEIGDRGGEASCYGSLGSLFQCLGQYVEAKVYLEKALAIRVNIGDKSGQATDYRHLGAVFQCCGAYFKAKEYYEKALKITTEIGNRRGQSEDYSCLGTVFRNLGEYVKAKEYHERALAIKVEICDRYGEGKEYGNLGILFNFLGQQREAKAYHEKALVISVEIGHRRGEADCCANLGCVFKCLADFSKAKKYLEKSLAMAIQIGDRQGEATCYGNLGLVLQSYGDYDKAQKHLEQALQLKILIGDRQGQAADYGNLGLVFASLGEYVKAIEYFEKALKIRKEVGDRHGEGVDYGNLGTTFCSLGDYVKAQEYLDKSLAIGVEIGDRHGEASSYGNLGTVFFFRGDYGKAKEYHEKALAIRTKIGDRIGEASNYMNLGSIFHSLGDYGKAEECLKKALSISKDTGDGDKEIKCLCGLTLVKVSEKKYEEAFLYLFPCIKKFEDMKGFFRENDYFKIAYSDMYFHAFPFRMLSMLLYAANKPLEALYALELGRARALADLMSAQYFVENQISADPQSWVGIENVIKAEKNCVCLYTSYSPESFLFCILKTSGVMHFRMRKVASYTLVKNLDVFLAKSFRSLGELSVECSEDRSLNSSNAIEAKSKLYLEESLPSLRIVEEEGAEDDNDPEPSLALYYKLLISPVADLLVEPEIIIVPDRSLYKVPFAALSDENGKYLSESFRIRIVPSLTTLTLIHDSPADYHSQSGALIVGDPEVGHVYYKGYLENISGLPFARREAEMIGRLLNTRPLLGQNATKQAVLQTMHSVSLIHLAAHGNAETGEIALAPERPTNGYPQERDFMLSMSDISKVGLRAKLVVLSCCHSASGQIRAEGVVGIARAFLGSGARSVLVALWAIEDSSTEQFMSRFYEHLIRGESASESLHQAMTWMRSNGYSDVRDWAPFMLIGDDVTFVFGKPK